jgi:aspartyl-tRNA(Asn)/glutamyl-tRNA(Gln) amidotransferase subunit C
MRHEEIAKIAALARIGLAPEETARLGAQFGDILKYVRKIDGLDLAGVEPVSHPFDVKNAFREDEPVPSSAAAEILAAAPLHERSMIRVPQVVEGKS